MERIKISDGLEFSRIAWGLWRLADDADTSPAHVQAKIEACLDQGITTFDQADIYGGYRSEAVLGGALRGAPALRDRMEIVTKCDIMLLSDKYPDRRVKHYDTSAAHIEASVEASLSNMGIERIDVLLIHRPDPLMDHNETGAALDRLVTSGKVGAVGVSNFRPWDWTLLQSAMSARLVTNQIEVSLSATDVFDNGDLAFLQERGVPPMAWSPLGGGGLMRGYGAVAQVLDGIALHQGVDRAAVAVAWLLRHPAKLVPVLGTNDLDRIARISEAGRVEMSRETWFELLEAARGCEVA